MTPDEIKREQLHRILDIVIDTNGMEARKQSITGTMPTVFMYFNGHVGVVDVEVHIDGWAPGQCKDKEVEFDLRREIPESQIEQLQHIMAEALQDKTQADILRREIGRREKDLADDKERLTALRRQLRKEERKNATK